MSLDLTQLDTVSAADDGAVMEVLHPVSGAVLTQADGNPVTIVLAGEDSELFRRADRAARNRRLKSQQAGRRVQISAEELENDSLELLVACTIKWQGIGLGDQSDLPFSAGNARMLYKRLPWLKEQAVGFIGDRANFLMRSAKS